MNFPGMTPPIGGAGAGAQAGVNEQEQAMIKMVSYPDKCGLTEEDDGDRLLTRGTSDTQMQAGMESCPVKTVIAGGMGFALGGAFGLFMASVCLSSCSCSYTSVRYTWILTYLSNGVDVLRHPPHPSRPRNHKSPLA
jgi:hypothetical protein